MLNKELEKIIDEIEKNPIPEPIIEIAKIIDPKLEEKYQIDGEDNWLLITKEEQDMIIKGGITFNMKDYSVTYSITIAKKTKNKEIEYQGPFEPGITHGGLSQFLKAFEETMGMIKDKKKIKDIIADSN